MKYVILKKINNVWYATRNRYTAQELEVIVDKLYDDIVDFELINDGKCQGIDNGVLIVADDGRELNENGTYLNDNLNIETEKKSINLWVYGVTFVLLLFFGFKITLMFGILYVLLKFIASFDNDTNKDVQSELPENHKAIGMM